MEKESFFLFRDSSTTLSINLLSVSVSISIGRSSLFLSLSLSHTLSLALSLSLSLSLYLIGACHCWLFGSLSVMVRLIFFHLADYSSIFFYTYIWYDSSRYHVITRVSFLRPRMSVWRWIDDLLLRLLFLGWCTSSYSQTTDTFSMRFTIYIHSEYTVQLIPRSVRHRC